MRTYAAVILIEQSPDTGLHVSYVPGFPGAHSQDETSAAPSLLHVQLRPRRHRRRTCSGKLLCFTASLAVRSFPAAASRRHMTGYGSLLQIARPRFRIPIL